MHVVILGGSGFIGSALAGALLARGDDVTVPTRGLRRPPAGTPAIWDGRDPARLAQLLEDADAVVNLLGEHIASGRWTAQRKARITESRETAGRAVAEAVAILREEARHPLPQVLVQASAVGYYGGWTNLASAPPRSESDLPGTGFLAETCIRWEASSVGVEHAGVRRCVIRSGLVLGLSGGALASMLPAFRAMVGGPLGSGRQPFPWIHLADEVAAILHLLDRQDCSGPYNLVAPQAVDNAGFARELNRALGRPGWLPVLPAPALILRAALGELAEEALLAGQVAPPDRLLASGFAFRHPQLPGALAHLLAG